MDMTGLDIVLRKPRGALWNDLKGTIILQKFSLCKTEGASCFECKLLVVWAQRHYLPTLEKAACGEPCSVTLTQGSWAVSLMLHMTREMPKLAPLGQRDLVRSLTRAGPKPDFLLWTWDFWLQQGSKSPLTAGDGKQGWPRDPFSVQSEMGINSCTCPSLSTYNRSPQEAKEGWATFRGSDCFIRWHWSREEHKD